MVRKIVPGIMSILLVLSMFTLLSYIQPVWAQGTIYIRADGSIDPPTAPISTVDNITYTLTGNITADADGIVVERDNIVVDGAGYTLQGTNADESRGTDVTGRSNVTIENTNIQNYWYGIYLSGSSNSCISGTNITANNWDGIYLSSSSGNSISENNITDNYYGIWLDYSSSYNSIFHNNFINNAQQVYSNESANVWDDGYPSGGNYWSDYTGVDVKNGPSQDQPGSDGIGDTAYVIDSNNTDYYPLMKPYFRACLTVDVTCSGSTNTTGTTTYDGFSNVTILATPGSGYCLSEWLLNGINVGVVNPYTINMTGNYHLTAVFARMEIVEVTPCDAVGNSQSTFEVGTLAYFKVVLNDTGLVPANVLITVNIYDSKGVTIGVASFQGPIMPGATTIIIGLPIPTNANLGGATVYASAFTDWISRGGVPYCLEMSATFGIER